MQVQASVSIVTMPAPVDDAAAEAEPMSPTSASEVDLDATIVTMQPTSPTASNSPLLPIPPTSSARGHHPSRRSRPRLQTVLRLSARSTKSYNQSAPHTASTYHYTLQPPTLSLSFSTLSNPLLPLHSATSRDTFTFSHVFPALDTPRAVYKGLVRPLLDGVIEGGNGGNGGNGSVVLVCYGEDDKAKAELLVGREGGAGVVVQTIGALLQSIRERERTQKSNDKQPQKAEQEEKREAEEDDQQHLPPPTAPPPRRRKYRLTFSALRLSHSTLSDLLSPNTPVSLSALSTATPTVDVAGWTEHRVREAEDCVKLLLRAEKQVVKLQHAGGGDIEAGHVVYRVGVESRWRRDAVANAGDESGDGRGKSDGYRQSSLTFAKLAVGHGSSASASSSSASFSSYSSSTSSAQPFSAHWINKDILALTRVLSYLLNPSATAQSLASDPANPHLNHFNTSFSASSYHIPYRSSPLTSTLSTALDQCSEVVLVFGLRDQTATSYSSSQNISSDGWDAAREEWRFVEGLSGGVERGKLDRPMRDDRRRGWRGAKDERDSDDEEEVSELTVLEYYKVECAKRAAALQPSSSSLTPPPSEPPLPDPPASRPATPPPATDPPPTNQPTEEKLSPALVPNLPVDAEAEAAKRQKDEEAATALQKRREKEADNRAAILRARQQQEQRDLDRELRTLQPLLTALHIATPTSSAKKPLTALGVAQLKAQVEQQLRQRVCAGMGVWKWSKKRVGGEVKRRECEVRWDEEGQCVSWEGRKRWRRVVKTVSGGDIERLVVGGGVTGGVLEEWKLRMKALAEQKKEKASADGDSDGGGSGGWSKAERAEMKRQFRAIDRWSISIVSGGRVLDVVCDSEECHVVLLEGLKRLLGSDVVVEDKRPGNRGMKVRDVKA